MDALHAEALELVKRVERVGWEVSPNGADSYRFRTPKGAVVLDLVNGERSSIRVIARQLEGDGLTEAEAAMTDIKADTTKTPRRPAKATFSAAEDERKATEDAANAARLAKAAGPYTTPEAVGITWFAQPHPSPWMRWVQMTPEIAGYLMREHNSDNRPLRPSRVEHYRRVILAGKWHLTHQGMAMDSRAVVQDGQHRLAAITEAGQQREGLILPVPFFVGMDPSNFLAIDEGLNRSAQDLFAKGGESYGTAIATVCRMTMAFETQSPRRMMRERTTNETVIAYFGTDPDEIRDCARWGVLNYAKVKTTAGPLAAARYVIRKANGADNRYVDAFFNGLVTGTKSGSRIVLDDNDPRAVTRSFFQNAREGHRRVKPLDAMSIVVMAWNNVLEDRRPRFVRFTDDSEIPRVNLGLDDGTDRAATASCPPALYGEVMASNE